jgi:hypothetical protein
MNATDRTRMESLLPWYVNGRIGRDDRAWLDALLREDDEARAALDWHLAVRSVIVTDLESLPSDIGLDGLIARVQPQVAPARSRRATGEERGFFARFLGGIGTTFTPRVAAFATALIMIQTAIIAVLGFSQPAPDHAAVRSVAPALAATQAIQISFRSGIAERDLRMLLTRVGARLADGPTQLGDYVVVVAPGRIETALRELELSGLVESAAVIEWQPAPRSSERELRP